MPQTDDETRARWCPSFDPTGTEYAMHFLTVRGWKLGRDWVWRRTTPPNPEEADAMRYLIEEWDFGGWDVSD
jgi:hypothetical protein